MTAPPCCPTWPTPWRKSKGSQNNGACVEVARVADVVGIRDSKDLNGPVLEFSHQEFDALIAGIKAGEFDL